MKKLMGLLIVAGLIVVGCSKTTTPTEPTDTPKYEIYFGQDAANHGFVAPSAIQAEKYTQAVYNEHRAIFETKTQKKEFDYEFDCNDIFDLLNSFGVNIPQNVRDIQCEGIIHAQRRSPEFLDWDVVTAVVAGYGLGYQGYVGGAGALNIAGAITRAMDSINIGLWFQVDYFLDSLAYVNSNQWGGRVAVGYGGVAFFDFPPTQHLLNISVIDRFFGSDPAFGWDWNKDITMIIDTTRCAQ